MTASVVLRFTGWVLLFAGVALLAAPGAIAVALGTPGPMPASEASDPAAMAFWRQLTFIRMFGTAALGLSAICLWSRSHLTVLQQVSFLRVLLGVLAAMCLMAVSQQTAIWGAGAGWALVGVLGAATLACLAGLARAAASQAV